MSIHLTLVLGGIACFAFAYWFLRLKPWLKQVRAYYQKVSVCGHLEPPPSPASVNRLIKTARSLMRIFVGRIYVVGKEKLDSAQAPFMFCSNHPSWADVAIAPLVLNRPARYLAHAGVFSALGGIGGWIAGHGGAIVAQDKIKDSGLRARSAGVKALVNGEIFVILPEGYTNYKETMGIVREGAIKIAREAAKQIGKPLPIYPAFIRYGKYPADWTLSASTYWFYLLMILLLPFQRKDAVVVFGDPFWTNELPENDAEATLLLRKKIEALDPGAQNFMSLIKTASRLV